MDIELISPQNLKPHPQNSRNHPPEQIAGMVASFRTFGFNGLIVIDENNTILAGHARTKAALLAEMQTVSCKRITGWAEEKKRAYVIADNLVADGATWDESLLLQEAKTLQNSEFDLATYGLDLADLLPPNAPPVNANDMRAAEAAAKAAKPSDESTDADDAYRREMANPTTYGAAPIVPMYSEHHSAFIIVTDNLIDEAWCRQRLGLEAPAASYADSKIRTPNIITIAQLRALLQATG